MPDKFRLDSVAFPEEAVKAPFPRKIKPMLCTLVQDVFDDDDWIFELKWDGFRAIAEVQDEVNLYSARQGVSYNSKFKVVRSALEGLGISTVLDGEIVAFGPQGKPEFNLVEGYPAKPADIRFIIFDILYYDGYDLQKVPLYKRKQLLKEILPESPVIRYCDHIAGTGKALFEEARKLDFEGIIMKRKLSRYKQDERGNDWLKLKIARTTDAVIIGYTPPEKAKLFGSLVLGIYNEDKLEYFGHAWHMTEELKRQLYDRMKALETDTPTVEGVPEKNIRRGIIWVKPELVCEVRYREMTKTGKLRQPVFLRLRDEVRPEEVQRSRIAQPSDEKKEGFEYQKLVNTESNETEVEVSGKVLHFINLKKVWFPELGLTKEDVLEYYHRIAPFILPFLRDRPQSFRLNQNGIYSKHLFKQSLISLSGAWRGKLPDWLQRHAIYAEKYKEEVPFALCQDEAHLLFFVQMGVIEMNPWLSRINSPDNPDYCVIDLDPAEGVAFDQVVEAALAVKKVLDTHAITGYIKTSGASGLHIHIPLGANYTFNKSRELAHLIAQLTNKSAPEITTLETSIRNRAGKVYLDYLQNNRSDSLAAPFSLRPVKDATVSCPLHWEEVKQSLSPKQFTYKTIFQYTDRWKWFYEGVMGKGVDL